MLRRAGENQALLVRAAAADNSPAQHEESARKALLSQTAARLTASGWEQNDGDDKCDALAALAQQLSQAFTLNRRRLGRQSAPRRRRRARARRSMNLPRDRHRRVGQSACHDAGRALATTARLAATHKTPRAPLLALLAYYTQYLVRDGSPLIVDFGFDDVPQVIPPGVVWTIFGLLLLPIL